MMSSLMAVIGLDVKPFEQKVADVNRIAHETGHHIKEGLGEGFGELAHHLPLLGGLAGVEESARQTVEWAKGIKLMAAEAGVGVGFLQGLEGASHKLGTSLENSGNSLAVLSRKIGQAREGGKGADLFEKWGIEIEGLSNEDVFYKIADRMAEMRDPAERSAMAFDLMGKGAKEMVVGLSLGSEAVREMITETEKLSDNQIAQLQQLDWKMEEIKHKSKIFFGNIITFGMEYAAPPGREDEVTNMVGELARVKGINLRKLTDEAHGKGKPGFDLKAMGAATARLDMLRKEAGEIVEKMHAPVPGGAAKLGGAKGEEKSYQELLRLRNEEARIIDQTALKEMTAAQRVEEIQRKILKIKTEIADAYDDKDEAESKVNLAKRQEELAAAQREADKDQAKEDKEFAKSNRYHAPAVNALQAIGGYVSERLMEANAAKSSEKHLASIDHKIGQLLKHNTKSKF